MESPQSFMSPLGKVGPWGRNEVLREDGECRRTSPAPPPPSHTTPHPPRAQRYGKGLDGFRRWGVVGDGGEPDRGSTTRTGRGHQKEHPSYPETST